MTEEEARKKWCPYTRYGATPDEWHTNRPSFMDAPVKGHDLCVASDCMAWRWVDTLDWLDAEDRVVKYPMSLPAGQYEKDGVSYRRAKNAHGYCGLAGRP